MGYKNVPQEPEKQFTKSYFTATMPPRAGASVAGSWKRMSCCALLSGCGMRVASMYDVASWLVAAVWVWPCLKAVRPVARVG